MPPSPATEELLREFETLARRHRAAFERLARRLTRNGEDAEDLLQETLVDAYRAFGRFRSDSHFYGWVARIMTNNHLDRVRRKQHPTLSLDQAAAGEVESIELPDDSMNPERLLLHRQMAAPLESALEALQPHHRATVLLCDLEGATYEEAAAAESCPIGTIRSRLHRAHAALRRFLAQFDVAAGAPAAVASVHSRRSFLRLGTAAAAGAALGGLSSQAAADDPIRVLVWTDSPDPSAAYPEGVHRALAEAIAVPGEIETRSASIRDPGHGLELAHTDVLVWLSQDPGAALPDACIAAVTRRVLDGRMGLLAGYDASLSPPLRALVELERGRAAPPEGERSLEIRISAPLHPIVRGVRGFRIPAACCGGELSSPRPPERVVLDAVADGSHESVPQGVVWRAGRGRVFCFRPGHSERSLYRQEEVRQLLRNAVRWLVGKGEGDSREAASPAGF